MPRKMKHSHGSEAGKAPEQNMAMRIRDGKTQRTRPLCPYPDVATYRELEALTTARTFVLGHEIEGANSLITSTLGRESKSGGTR